MSTGLPDRLLSIPWIYRLAQIVLAPGAPSLLKETRERLFAGLSGHLLDIGCGPDPAPPGFPGVMVGIDIDEGYVRSYSGGFTDTDPTLPFHTKKPRQRFAYLTSASSLPFSDASFEAARAIGFFHHLPDDVSNKVLAEAFRCLKPGGRIIIQEPIWPRSFLTRPLAWLILRFDRGKHVRTEIDLRSILTASLPGPWQFKRMTYAYTGLECLWAVYSKSAETTSSDPSGQALSSEQNTTLHSEKG